MSKQQKRTSIENLEVSLNKNQPRPNSKATQLDNQSRIISRNSQYPNQQKSKQLNILNGQLGDYKLQFTLLRQSKQIIIKCTPINLTQNLKKLFCNYQYDRLPKAVQITYQSIEELFEEFKYIIEQNITNQRLKITPEGKFIFNLETKKKGKSQFVPETFDLEQENEQKRIQRLQQEIERLSQQNLAKEQRLTELYFRLSRIQQINGIKNQNISTFRKTFNDMSANNTIQTQFQQPYNKSIGEESIIKKFKKTKSTEDLSLKNIPQANQTIQSIDTQAQSQVLKTTINDFDCFFQLQDGKLKIEILSRQQARIYKCTIDNQSIPKQVYSFVPTPVKLYDEISYIISNQIKGRLDVIDTNFIYRASINEKKRQVLIDGVFETFLIKQDNLQRIQELVDLRTSTLTEDITYLKLELGLLKKNLEYNGLILEMPEGFCNNNSKIIITDTQYITLCKFFKKKIYKIDLLYRASEHNFQIKRFHDKCDGIPNTLTVVLTEFDKKIGGYTPLPWDKNGNDKFLTDYENSSFIFSLTNSHKFALEQNEFATKIGIEDGPRFGNGADLVIKDKADENNNSYANICTSYFHKSYTYKSVQSYERFSGDEKTNRFKVKEWELYEIFFEQ